MGLGRGKTSPRRTVNPWRPGPASAKRHMVTSLALNKATKALSSVDASTQRGNIKVVVRVRPPNPHETTASSRIVVHAVDSHMVLFDPPDDVPDFYFKGVRQTYTQKTRHKNSKLAFDNVYGPGSTNTQIFDDVINPMLDTLLNGFNCSVFAYGATGSGKTHTMLGTKDNPGLTFLTVMELYKRLDALENDYKAEVAVSYLEVYNETVKDLLHSSGDLQLREDSNGVAVPSLTSHKPKNSLELLNLLSFGNSVRSQHPTDHNAESSRSHAVFQVFINLRSNFTELTSKYKSAKLVMVDLAGSERGAATGFQGQRFREGASINKSLLSLGNCINALADGKKHIPYRDSKLTRILKDSLGGNCKTVMIANVSPSNLSYDDSYNTLRYADRAKRIKFQAKKNTMSVSACLTQYTKVVEEMSHKIDQLQSELDEFQKNCNCINPKVDAGTDVSDLIPQETATNVENGNIGHSFNTGFPSIPSHVLARYNELWKKKKETVFSLFKATAAIAVASTKIGVKDRRIKSIKKLKSAMDDKNTYKLKKQLEPLLYRHKEAWANRKRALKALNKVDSEYEMLQSQYEGSNDTAYVSVKFSDYIELQNLKIEKQTSDLMTNSYKEISMFYAEEVEKDETLIGNSIEFMNSQYLINKHYKNNTKQMDSDYEGLIANLCGTKVHWSGDIDKESTIPSLKNVLFESFLSQNDEDHMDTCNPYDEQRSYNISSRPQTPPIKYCNMSNMEDDDETSEVLKSVVHESSIHTNLAGVDAQNETFTAAVNYDTMNLTVTESADLYSNANDTITIDDPVAVSNLPIPVFLDVSEYSLPEYTVSSSTEVEEVTDDLLPCFIENITQKVKYEFPEKLLEIPPAYVKENVDPLTYYRDEEQWGRNITTTSSDTTFDVTFNQTRYTGSESELGQYRGIDSSTDIGHSRTDNLRPLSGYSQYSRGPIKKTAIPPPKTTPAPMSGNKPKPWTALSNYSQRNIGRDSVRPLGNGQTPTGFSDPRSNVINSRRWR